MTNDIEHFTLDELPSSIKEKEIKDFLSKIFIIEDITVSKKGKKAMAIVSYLKKNIPDISVLDEIDGKTIPGTNIKIKVCYSQSNNTSVLTHNILAKTFKENEVIEYKLAYEKHIQEHFIRAIGSSGLKFIEEEITTNQRNVIKHFITKIGSNILSGSGIMNVSLPVNIFDQRSLLEVFAHQCRLSPYFLEKAGETKDPIEKIKLSTA